MVKKGWKANGSVNFILRANPSNAKKWKKVQPLVKTYLTNLVRILGQISDEKMLQYVLKGSEAALAYFSCFPKCAKDFVKVGYCF